MKFKSRIFFLSFGAGQLLFLLICLFLHVARIPDTLTLDMSSNVDGVVQVGHLRDDGTVRQFATCPQGGGVKPIYLPVDDKCRDKLSFGICCASGVFQLKSVILHKWLVVPFKLSEKSLEEDFATTEGVALKKDSNGMLSLEINGGGYLVPRVGHKADWRFSPGVDRHFLYIIIFIEGLIVLLSILLGWLGKPVRKRYVFGASICVAATVALFFVMILPVQSYLVNRVSFPYSLGNLIQELLLDCIIVFIVVFVGLLLYGLTWGRFVFTAVIGLVIYCYLSTGFLAAGLPSLDGDFRFFAANTTRQVVDIIVMLVCIGGCIAATKWIAPYLHWVSLGILVLSGASLFDVRVEDKAVESNEIGGAKCSVEDLTKSGFFSSNGNVIVLVPDSVSTEMAAGVFSEDVTIRDVFSGFTFYTNNIGMHSITPLGLPGLITGRYCETLHNLKAHQAAVAGQDSFITPFARGNPSFALLDINPNFHWTNRLSKEIMGERNAEKDDAKIPFVLRRINDLQSWNLFEIVRFRLTPFLFKYQMAFLTMKDWPMFDRGSSETRLYPLIAKYPVQDEKMTLHVYHTEGSHFPFQVGKHGERLPEPLQTYEGMYNKTFFVFTNIAKLLMALKEKGVYDNSAIIIAADHGSNHTHHDYPPVDGVSFEASKPFPVLMVKPMNAKGEMRCSSIPTSHTKISTYVKNLLLGKEERRSPDEIFRTDKRFYRDFDPKSFECCDFVFDTNGVCIKAEKHR